MKRKELAERIVERMVGWIGEVRPFKHAWMMTPREDRDWMKEELTKEVLEALREADQPALEEEQQELRTVTEEEWERLYDERMQALEKMPGGAQGAHPDMTDVEIGEVEDD